MSAANVLRTVVKHQSFEVSLTAHGTPGALAMKLRSGHTVGDNVTAS